MSFGNIIGAFGRLRRLAPAAPPTSPDELIRDAPPPIARHLRDRTVIGMPPSPPPKRHWMYRVGNDLVLHVYGGNLERIRRSLPDREALQRDLDLPGVPRLHASHDDGERIWVIEDRLVGRSPHGRSIDLWFPLVRSWLVRFAGPPGPPLHSTAFWDAHRAESILATPHDLRTLVASSWDAIGDTPARTLHGDAQPRNVLICDEGPGLIDWEGFWRFGIPGLDLVFLSIMARGEPDEAPLRRLLANRERPRRALRPALRELGIEPRILPAAILVMLATWSLGETRRIARGGRQIGRTPFQAMLSRFASRVARVRA